MKITAATMTVIAALASGAPLARAAWFDNTELKGDLRYRFEYIDEEGREERYRDRIRARLGLTSKVNDEVKLTLQLTTAQSNEDGEGDPISGNQSLRNFGTRKGMFLDLAYFDWKPATLPGLSLTAGKMKNPFVCVGDYLFDNDYNPEGLAFNYTLGSDVQLLVNGGYHWIQERSSADDSMMFGGQIALNVKAGDMATVTFGGSYYGFTEVEGQEAFDWEDGGDFYGNTSTTVISGSSTNDVYANGFGTAEGFLQVAFDVGIPITVFGSYAVNAEADEDDTGFIAGIKFGQAKEPGTFEFGYDYRRLEANVFPGAFPDSDMFGGGTDAQGHRFKVAYQILKNFQSAVTYFLNEKDLEDPQDYNRLQVDLIAKF
jgi:hypothetical protein